MTDNHDLDTLPGWTALRSAGQVQPATNETLARARGRLPRLRTTSRRSHRLVPALAAGAVLVAALVIYQAGNDNPEPPTAGVPQVTSLTSPTPRRSVNVAKCVEPARIQRVADAQAVLDGTVLRSTVLWSESRGSKQHPAKYVLSVQVHEWLRGGSGQREVRVVTWTPPGRRWDGQQLAWQVGDRLLIAGMNSMSGAEVQTEGCGYSQPYTKANAAAWRELTRK